MSNSYFRFKQFTIHQDRCGMKVSTDACIQGAWAPVEPHVKRVLDIGAGTGLLSLMLAQRNSGIITDAIELDAAAAEQAKENVAVSPWAGRIIVMQGDVKSYPFAVRYDMVICNPPFFINSLQSDEQQRNNARHDVALGQEDLLEVIDKCTNEEGYAVIMLPPKEHNVWQQLCEKNGWHAIQKLEVQPREGKDANRIIGVYSRTKAALQSETLAIKKADDSYTEAFTELLRPFYLFL
ncbi:MAG: methyltransferase [Bacteroidetes bacterium]|nr:methyltransferase [Bacteroidota bacterium]